MDYAIGPGVLQAIKDAGDEPRGPEFYTHDPATGDMLYSETMGRDAKYVYLAKDNTTKRLPFD